MAACDSSQSAITLQMQARQRYRLLVSQAFELKFCLHVAGVINLVHLINEIKQHHPAVSYADTFQLGSALSIEV